MEKQKEQNIYHAWKKIESHFGIDAWEEVRDFIWKQQEKIKELTKSRDNWRIKFEKLKNKGVENEN